MVIRQRRRSHVPHEQASMHHLVREQRRSTHHPVRVHPQAPRGEEGTLRTGHRNRSEPPFELPRQLTSTFSDWMPARRQASRPPRPAAAGGHRRRARSIRRSAAPVCLGLRVRPVHRLVATTPDARLCTTLGLLMAAAAMRAAQARRHARTLTHRGKMPRRGAQPPGLSIGSVAATRVDLIH